MKDDVYSGVYLSLYNGINWSKSMLVGASNAFDIYLQAVTNGTDFLITWVDQQHVNALTVSANISRLTINDSKQLTEISTFLPRAIPAASGETFGIAVNDIYGISVFTMENDSWSEVEFKPNTGYFNSDAMDFAANKNGFAIIWFQNVPTGYEIYSNFYMNSTGQWDSPTVLDHSDGYRFVKVAPSLERFLFVWYGKSTEKLVSKTASGPDNIISTQMDISNINVSEIKIASSNENFIVYTGYSCNFYLLGNSESSWHEYIAPKPDGTVVQPHFCDVDSNIESLAIASGHGIQVFDSKLLMINEFGFSADIGAKKLKLTPALVGYGAIYRSNGKTLHYMRYSPGLGWGPSVELGSMVDVCTQSGCYNYPDSHLVFNTAENNVWAAWIETTNDYSASTLHLSQIDNGLVNTIDLMHLDKPLSTGFF